MGEGGALSAAAALADLDLWAPVSTDALPPALVEAIENADWPAAKVELSSVLDSLNTDGVHGRALVQLAQKLPIGMDPVFDRYRGAVAIDYGNWDDLRRCMDAAPIAVTELEMARQSFLASVSVVPSTVIRSPVEAPFQAYDFILSARPRLYRQWARRLATFDGGQRWVRRDVPVGRHFRIQLLHHSATMAFSEATGGSLPVAAALAREAKRLGDDGEPLRDIAEDLELLALFAMGERQPRTLKLFERAPTPQGPSPLGTFEWLSHVIPFLALYPVDVLASAAQLMQRIGRRFGSPKAQLIGESWVVAAQVARAQSIGRTDLPALLTTSRHADIGLRVLPELLQGIASLKYSSFYEAERLARASGSVWAQVTALTWMVALDPTPRAAVHLSRLLRASGWRRPVLVPEAVLSDAALGLLSLGVRGQPLIELALASGRSPTATEVASRHATDSTLDSAVRAMGLEALVRIGTTHARRVLADLTRSLPDLARVAGTVAERTPRVAGLSDREIEVLDLAGRGLTNRQIAERLTLSHHTVARHLANARDKLGAVNRADAAVRLGRLTDPGVGQGRREESDDPPQRVSVRYRTR